MSMEQTKKVFAERYYHWCVEQWRQELKDDYPHLRASRCETALEAIDVFETFSREERWQTATALVRRKIQGLFEGFDNLYTEKDQRLVQKYWKITNDIHQKNISDAGCDSSGFMIQPRINRLHFRKAIRDAVKPILGEYEDNGGGVWIYKNQIGGWTVRTEFDTGGNFHQLCYSHGIILSSREELLSNISLTDWLGISGQMDWRTLSEADIKPVSQFVAEIVSYFLHAAPQLLDGLASD